MSKPFRIPKSPGLVADRIYEIRALKKPHREALEALDEEEKALKEHLINTISMDDNVRAGNLARAEIELKSRPNVVNRVLFEKYILKTKDFSLLQKTPSAPAIRERWDLGEKVPGVEPFQYKDVSITKK